MRFTLTLLVASLLLTTVSAETPRTFSIENDLKFPLYLESFSILKGCFIIGDLPSHINPGAKVSVDIQCRDLFLNMKMNWNNAGELYQGLDLNIETLDVFEVTLAPGIAVEVSVFSEASATAINIVFYKNQTINVASQMPVIGSDFKANLVIINETPFIFDQENIHIQNLRAVSSSSLVNPFEVLRWELSEMSNVATFGVGYKANDKYAFRTDFQQWGPFLKVYRVHCYPNTLIKMTRTWDTISLTLL
ncbi:hypothetical protein RCL1_007817 [Eukaryota sp. TZLM3-RCL]